MTESKSKVEEVARAMWAADTEERTAPVFPGGRSANLIWSKEELSAENYGLIPMEREREEYRRRARAAIEALRDPNAAMVQAVLKELSDSTVRDPKAAAWDWGRAHHAAIVAALNEEGE